MADLIRLWSIIQSSRNLRRSFQSARQRGMRGTLRGIWGILKVTPYRFMLGKQQNNEGNPGVLPFHDMIDTSDNKRNLPFHLRRLVWICKKVKLNQAKLSPHWLIVLIINLFFFFDLVILIHVEQEHSIESVFTLNRWRVNTVSA